MTRPHLNKRQILAAALAALVPAAARAGDAIRIPFGYFRDWFPVIPVSLDGNAPVPFLFSTGASTNVVKDDYAEQLGLKSLHPFRDLFDSGKTVSAGEVRRTHDVGAQSVKIGGVFDIGPTTFSVSPATPKDLAYRAKHSNEENFSRGVLGTDLFCAAPCILDYEAVELIIYPSGLDALDGFQPLQANFRTRDHETEITVDARLGDDWLRCSVDTAGRADLYLASRYVRERDLYNRFKDAIDSPLDPSDPSKGVVRTVRMQNFDLGGVHFDEINVTLGDPQRDDHLGEIGVRAVIGRGLLKQFSLAFPGHGRLLIKPNGAFRRVADPWVPILTDD